jgi:hypothetical protein
MSQFQSHNYKVIEKNDENYRHSVIEKDNIKATFTVRDFEDNIAAMQRTIKEVSAKYEHEKVIMANIEEHHPFVKDMSEQDILTVWMYREAQEVVKQYEPRIVEFKKALETEQAELEYVKEQLKGDLGIDNGEQK